MHLPTYRLVQYTTVRLILRHVQEALLVRNSFYSFLPLLLGTVSPLPLPNLQLSSTPNSIFLFSSLSSFLFSVSFFPFFVSVSQFLPPPLVILPAPNCLLLIIPICLLPDWLQTNYRISGWVCLAAGEGLGTHRIMKYWSGGP